MSESTYRVSQKNVLLWKNSHNYLQTHPKCKSWGCFEKFRIFATRWALRFSKLRKKWLKKWSLKLPTPPHNALKNGWEDQSMYIQSTEFCPFLEGGLATLSFIFSVISSSILKSQCPFCSKYPEFFKTPQLLHFGWVWKVAMVFFHKRTFFWDTLYINGHKAKF